MKIGNYNIGVNHRPFIIAEMSGNHNQSLDRALQIVEKAAFTGVQAIKLQTYTADTITMNVTENEFVISDKNSLWAGRTLYDLYDEAHTPWSWHKPIMDKAKELNLLCFSSPFDLTSVDFLDNLNVPAYKIASPEITHLPLIEKVAKTGKPMIISTGMATVSEIGEAVSTARENGCNDIVLLKCTSSYPASPQNSNILTIPNMREVFGCEVGLSDHTLGIGVAIASIAYGATIIEKHFTLKRSEGGVDSAFSMEPDEMKLLNTESITAWQALGKIQYGIDVSEAASFPFRQSIYVSKDLKKGSVLSEDNIRIVRPGFGLEPKFWDIVLGLKINRDVRKGTGVSWELIN